MNLDALARAEWLALHGVALLIIGTVVSAALVLLGALCLIWAHDAREE